MAKSPKTFDRLYVNMIKAGEAAEESDKKRAAELTCRGAETFTTEFPGRAPNSDQLDHLLPELRRIRGMGFRHGDHLYAKS